MKYSFRKSKHVERGLENIVGAVLLLAIVGVLIPIIYMYLAPLVSGSVSEAARLTPLKSFIITAVNYSSGKVYVYVLNTGTVPVTLIEGLVLNITNPDTYTVVCNSTFYIVVPPHNSTVIPISCTLSEKNSYEIIIYSWNGFRAKYVYYYSYS